MQDSILEQFYMYAAFHIGLCLTASALLIVVVGFASEDFKRRFRRWFRLALVTFIVAGAVGVFVAGHIIYIGYVYPWNLYKASFFFMYLLFGLGIAIGMVGLWRMFLREKKPVITEVKVPPVSGRRPCRTRGISVTPYVFQVVRPSSDAGHVRPQEVHIMRAPKGRRRKLRLSVYVPAGSMKR